MVVGAGFSARGDGGCVTFDGRDITIDRTGGVSFIMHGMAGIREIPLHEVSAVKLQRARAGARGYLQLRLIHGDNDLRGGSWDENSILFDQSQQSAFEALARRIRIALRESRTAVLVTSAQDAEEPLRLQALRRMEIITVSEIEVMSAGHRDIAQSNDRPRSPRTSWSDHHIEALSPPDAQSTAQARAAFLSRWAPD